MHRGYKVVATVPAGRKRTMSLLLKHLRSNMDILDGVQLWHNTENIFDTEFIMEQADDFVQVIPLDPYDRFRNPLQTNTGRFYLNTMDEDTIYIRFDDDVVYIHQDAIRNIVDARIDNPNAFALCATTWNNAVVSHLLQKNGVITSRHGEVKKYCMDDLGWKNAKFAEYMHNLLLSNIDHGSVDQLYMPHHLLSDRTRFSVSAICWFGKYWKTWDNVPLKKKLRKPLDTFPARQLWNFEEEQWINDDLPAQVGLVNLVLGNAIVAHYTFYHQKDYIDSKTNILKRYEDIADRMYHDKYYDLIRYQNEFQSGEREKYSVVPWFEQDWAIGKSPLGNQNW